MRSLHSERRFVVCEQHTREDVYWKRSYNSSTPGYTILSAALTAVSLAHCITMYSSIWYSSYWSST